MLISAVLCILPVMILHSISINSYEKVPEESSTDSKITFNIYSVIDILNRPGIANILLKKNAPIVPMLLCFAIIQFLVIQVYIIDAFNASSEICQLIQMLTGSSQYDFDSISFILFFYFSSLWMIFLIMPFIALGMSLVATVADSLLTTFVEENEQGLILGIASTLNSFVRTFSPEAKIKTRSISKKIKSSEIKYSTK
uniref:Uncharacterized protein n=1 Tax=Heterorhabditis bacteriophora TaxID=37862 RepID=A0A1I7WYT7_HETBA